MSKKEIEMADKAFNAAIVIEGISMTLAGLVNQLDAEKCDSLTNESLEKAIYAIRMHLERIADDLENITK